MTGNVVYTAATRAEYDEVAEVLEEAGVRPIPLDELSPRRVNVPATQLSWRIRIAVPVEQLDAARAALLAWQASKTRAVRSHVGEVQRIVLISLPIVAVITGVTVIRSEGDPAGTLTAALLGSLATIGIVSTFRHRMSRNKQSPAP